MKKSSNKGFTLVELIIVIAILAIIMLIAIPNFSGIQQRMQVRADKATAAQIGKAVRIWYTEYQSDPAFKAVVDDGQALPGPGSAMVALKYLTSIDGYVDKTLEPTSLRTETGTQEVQRYFVGLVGSGTYEKVAVSIAKATITGDPETAAAATNATSVTLPDATATGGTGLSAKDDVLYDGTARDTVAKQTFKASLAYLEP